jgi:hypothetical protein
MKDLYKIANFPTVVDIYGEECYVSLRKYDNKFNIELCFGRPVEKTAGRKRIIFTRELKCLIEETKKVPIKEFTGELSTHIVRSLRRKLKENPYKTYQEWLSSRDPDKPSEITFLNVKSAPQYIKDYLGTTYVLLSAKITKTELVCFMGIEKKIYFEKDKKTKRYILTQELVKEIKKHKLYPHKNKDIFPFDMQTFYKLRKEITNVKQQKEEVNLWYSAHLSLLFDMTIDAFTQTYAKDVEISRNSVASVKAGLNHLVRLQRNRTEINKKLLALLRKNERKYDSLVQLEIFTLLGQNKDMKNKLIRAFHLVSLAKQLNHPLPRVLSKLEK